MQQKCRQHVNTPPTVMTRGKLRQYQDTYAQAMAGFGLKRGVVASGARHQTQQQYNRQQALELQTDIDRLTAEIEKLAVEKEKVKKEAKDGKNRILSWLGFQVGERTKEVQKILFALDATADLVREAVEFHCDLIVTHHPFLFHPQKQFLAESPAFQAAKHNIAVISAHTSYDCAAGGVNDILAETVGLSDIRTSDCGMFRIGTVPAQSAKDFAKAVKSALQTQVSVRN